MYVFYSGLKVNNFPHKSKRVCLKVFYVWFRLYLGRKIR